jgi:hypothetical protein
MTEKNVAMPLKTKPPLGFEPKGGELDSEAGLKVFS